MKLPHFSWRRWLNRLATLIREDRPQQAKRRYRSTRRLGLEALEDRIVPSAYMLKDIGVALTDPEPRNITAVGATLYFTFSDSTASGLGKYDGTNFTVVKSSSSFSSNPYDLTAVGSDLYFVSKESTGPQLWKYDGSNLSEIQVGTSANPNPSNLTAAGSNLYFTAYDGTGYQLFKYDGSNLSEIKIGTYSEPAPFDLTAVGSNIYLSASDVTGNQLWKYDGSTVSEIKVGSYSNPLPGWITALGSNIYFDASDGTGYQLWKYDGSKVSEIKVGTYANPSPYALTAFGSNLFFGASDGTGDQLWKYDGSTVSEIKVGSNANPQPYILTVSGSNLYFFANASTGNQLWKYDGSTVSEINAGRSGNSQNYDLKVVGSDVYYVQFIDNVGWYLFKYDGNNLSQITISNLHYTDPYDLTSVGSSLYFGFQDGSGSQLWSYDTTSGTLQLHPLYTPLGSSWANSFVQMGGKVYFSAEDGVTGWQLWVTDGTTNGTTRISDMNPNGIGLDPYELTVVGNDLYFGGYDGSSFQLWKYDGSNLAEIKIGTAVNPDPSAFMAVGSNLYFIASDAAGQQLWKYDGTTLTEIKIGDSANPSPFYMTAVGSTLYFVAPESTYGYQLWKYDGTNLSEIVVTSYGIYGPENLEAVGGSLYYDSYDGTGWKLFKYDGSNISAIQVGTYANPHPYDETLLGSNLYFVANDGTGYQLWKYDGTTATEIKFSAYANPDPSDFVSIGTTLYFDAYDGTGSQLWKYDGTNFSKINLPTYLDPYYNPLTAVGSELYLSDSDGIGNQLWRYDGSNLTEITINPNGPSNPYELTAVGNALYLVADDGAHGFEPWVVVGSKSAPTVPTPVVPTNAAYNGQPQGASVGDVIGDNGVDLGPPTLTYYAGTYTLANLPTSGGTSSAPTNAGNYTVVASFVGNADYFPAESLATYTISPATPEVSVVDAGGIYNGNSFPAGGTALGVDHKTAVPGSFSYAYYPGSSASGTPSATPPTNAGSYTVVATFASSDSNYTGGSAQTTFTIAKATPSVTVTDSGGTFNGNASPAVGTALGVDGKTAVAGSFSYAYYVGTTASGTPLTTVPTNADTYTVVATFTSSDPNYTGGSAQITLTIAKATASVTVTDGGGIYNGNPYRATATVAGVVRGVDNTSASRLEGVAPTLTYYSGGTPLAGAPVDAGSYTVVASFAGSTDYTTASASTTFTIAKATTVLSNLTVQQIILGTGTTTVSGQLTSNTIVPVGQSVPITINAVTESAKVGADGSFSVSFPTSALGVGTYSIQYSYPGDTNFTSATGTSSLTVAYGTQLLFDNTEPVHGAVLPIKLALTDASGVDVSSPNIVVTAVGLVDSNGNPVTLSSKGNANPNDEFRYDPGLGGYVFHLDTKGLASGTYTLYYMAGNDPTRHSLTFAVD